MPGGETALGAFVRAAAASAEVCLLVGPEGGLEAGEVEAARAAGLLVVGLGPLVLRTETVCAAALGALLTSRRPGLGLATAGSAAAANAAGAARADDRLGLADRRALHGVHAVGVGLALGGLQEHLAVVKSISSTCGLQALPTSTDLQPASEAKVTVASPGSRKVHPTPPPHSHAFVQIVACVASHGVPASAGGGFSVSLPQAAKRSVTAASAGRSRNGRLTRAQGSRVGQLRRC